MNEIKLTVHPFLMGDAKEAALKPLEESAEIYGAWQDLYATQQKAGATLRPSQLLGAIHENRDALGEEIADCITACVNLADRYGIDLQDAINRVEQRNRIRGRYTDE